MHLLYLVFGQRESYHYEAVFSIFSFLATSKTIEKVHVYTDAPQFYKYLGNHVDVQEVSTAKLEEWKGKYHFFWRVKIKALEDCHLKNPNNVLVYLDSDTFLYQGIEHFENLLNSGKALMHKNEGLLSQGKSKTEKRMWAQVANKAFGKVIITPNHAMWNAGVVVIPVAKQMETIQLALAICDDMCAQKVTPRLIEQFSLAVALQEMYTLQPAEDFVGHYWSNKNEWDCIIEKYFIVSHLQNKTMEEEIEGLKGFDFNQIPIFQRERRIHSQVNSILQKWFPHKKLFLQAK